MAASAAAAPTAAGAAIAAIAEVRCPTSPETIAALACSSAAMNWSASAGRSAGFLLSAHITTCSSSAGRFGLTMVGAVGASETCLMAIVTA
jgi:hypothetical protein